MTKESNRDGSRHSVPSVELARLDVLWFQVSGTLCNLACTHCFISCSPTNHTHQHLTLAEVEAHLEDAVRLGVKEVYFTGGEPFLNPQMEQILEAALAVAPTSVLTNGLLLDESRCERLAALSLDSSYSLDLRVSLDGFEARSNDPIRGEGTFDRVLRAVQQLHHHGLNPVLTVTEVSPENGSEQGKNKFLELLRSLGIAQPRLKVLPVFQLGAEVERSTGYQDWQRLRDIDATDDGWDHLQCSSCRMVTKAGVWVCPILVNEPQAKMGERLGDALRPFQLEHSACWTCHVHGVTCST